MRTFEMIIVLLNLPFLYWLLFPSSRFPGWARFIPVLAAITTIIHLFVEKYRWQMLPLYLWVLIILFIVVTNHFLKNKQQLIQNKILSILLGVIAVLFLGTSTLLGTLLPVFSLPQPTGPYPVGTVTYHWIDETRDEVHTQKDTTDKREIMVQFWYPAEQVENAKPNYYWQDYSEIIGPKLAKSEHLPEFIFSHFNLIKTNAVLGVPLSNKEKTFPVVLYAHGAGCARSWATNQMEELASHGYIVIALDRTYSSLVTVFPDGQSFGYKSPFKYVHWSSLSDSLKKAIKDRKILFATRELPNSNGIYDSVGFANNLPSTDISFTINKLEELNKENCGSIFKNRINLKQIGAIGFSNGGGIIKKASRSDQRIKAIILLDSSAPQKSNIQQPILCIVSEFYHFGEPKIETLKKYIDKNRGQKIMLDYVLIKRTIHNNFTDGPYYSPLKSMTGAGPIDPVYAHHIINTFIVGFFDENLKGKDNISIAGLAKNFPEVYYDSIKNE